MNEQELKSLYASWRSRHADHGADADEISRLALDPSGGAAEEQALGELAAHPASLAAYRIARELAPNTQGLSRALGAGHARIASVPRPRQVMWAAAAAVAFMLLAVQGVERQREHRGGVASHQPGSHDTINAGSFEGGDGASSASADTVFRSDFDG